MFNIKHIQDTKKFVNYLELKNTDNSCFAKIDLTLGGSLQELKLGNKLLISSDNPSGNPFHSSVLFPFVNRIENGKYGFNNKDFILEQNEPDRGNALHGLVFDKTFSLIGKDTSKKGTSVILCYEESAPPKGFPFKYAINLQYILTKITFELKVEIKNKDEDEFPFSLGWHPYFCSEDLFNSHLKLNSHKKLLVNDKMIPNGEEDIDWNKFLQIEDKAFDDCFVLNNNKVEFKTPEYHLEFTFSSRKNYLQLYTPDNRKCIAIEPQTAPANSFNNNIGLQILKPDETYNVCWKINLI